MPRNARKCPGNFIYHVMNRSVARIKLFRNDKDYIALLKTLTEAIARTNVGLLAYCAMPTHWHLVLKPQNDGDLSAFMQWFTLTHVQRWRTSHDTVGYGPLYQGRFKAFVIQQDRHLLTVLRYVERNPLRAKLVRRAEDWPWSSLSARLREEPQGWQPPMAAWPVQIPEDWGDRVNTAQTAAEEKAVLASISRSRPFGEPGWGKKTARELGLESCFRPAGRPKHAKINAGK